MPALRQAGRACSASCVLFSYSCKNSFDLMTAESFTHFCWILCTRPALHLLPLVCVLVLVAVRFTLWTMMAELCFSVDDFSLFYIPVCDEQYSSRHCKVIQRPRAPSLLDSSGLVPLLLPLARWQTGRDCAAFCVLFSYSLLCALDCGR